jgi:3alpha-hydroxysteroid 3-dehydrogenase
MRTIGLTGSASGIGAATRAHLERAGHRVIGIDQRDADICGDLGTVEGRALVMGTLAQQCDGRLDGFVACAGVGPQVESGVLIVAVNYFGAQATLAAAQPLLARGAAPAAVAVASNSASLPNALAPLVDICLRGDEAAARTEVLTMATPSVYGAAKRALALWVRREAPGPAWAGAGIRLNAVVPGAVQTPLLQGGLDTPGLGDAIRNFPIPLGGFGTPAQIAAAIAFLLSPDSAFCCGTLLFADGGTDALLRPTEF